MTPVLAISNRPFRSTQALIHYCSENEIGGVDYSFPYEAKSWRDIQTDAGSVEEIGKNGLKIRYHCPFLSVDLAYSDKATARRSLDFFKLCVDFARDFGGEYMTVHIGLDSKSTADLDYETAIAHLSELVEYGRQKNLVICLENLTQGWTSTPKAFFEIIKKTEAGVTFDLGHANACPWVVDRQGTSVDFLRKISEQVINAHVYEIETIIDDPPRPHHVFPQDLSMIEPLLSELMITKCDWWLIELSELKEVDHTRSLLQSFLSTTL